VEAAKCCPQLFVGNGGVDGLKERSTTFKKSFSFEHVSAHLFSYAFFAVSGLKGSQNKTMIDIARSA
jgi:hypothetical protein